MQYAIAHLDQDGKHGEHIDGETGQIHDEESSNQRNGDYNTWHKRHTPIAQEEENDDEECEHHAQHEVRF